MRALQWSRPRDGIRVGVVCWLLSLAACEPQPQVQGVILPVVEHATTPLPRERTLVLEIDERGELRSGGERLSFRELHETLVAHGKAHPDPKHPRPYPRAPHQISRANLLLRLHRNLPVAAFIRILELCSQLEVGIRRIHVATRQTASGPVRAVPVFLPIDQGSSPPRIELWTVRVELRYSLPSIDEAPLFDRIQRIPRLQQGPSRLPSLTLHPDRSVPMEVILRTMDAAHRLGFEQVQFNGEATLAAWNEERPNLADHLASLPPAPDRRPGVKIGDIEPDELEVEEDLPQPNNATKKK